MTGQQLKNSILQMAVQGKLVPQDPNDEPASVLLERIRAEKERLIKEKKIKKEKNPSVIFRSTDNSPYTFLEKIEDEVRDISDEIPFDIPESWEWVRGSSLGEIVRGSGIKRTETVSIGLPCVRYGELYTTYSTSFTNAVSYISDELNAKCKHFFYGDVLLTLTGENKPDIAKAIAYLGDVPVAAGGDLAYWTHHGLNPLYLVYALSSPYAINRKVELATGDIIVHISGDKIGSILLPIPPLSEQDRIVKRVQEIETLIIEYGNKEKELSQLQNSFPTQLKKSILQQAVQGKLVPQNPDDEPASVLLERIRIEKQELIKAGKIKKDKNESVIFRRDNSHYEKLNGVERCIDDEIPFEVPESWQWERWGNISTSIQYGYNAAAQSTGRIKMVRISDIQNNVVMWDTVPFCDILEADIETYLLKTNDILFARTGGTVGKSYLVKDVPKDAVYAGYLIRTRYSSLLCPEYLKYFMESELYWSQLRSGTIATAQPNCNGKTLANMFIPIPPFEEQRNIVKRISQLFKYCEKL